MTDWRSCKHNIGGDVEKWPRRHGLGERIAQHTDGILTRGCLQYTRRGDISVLRWLLFRNIVFFILEFEPPTMTRGVRILDDGEFIDCQVPPVADFPNAVCHHTCGMTKKSKKKKWRENNGVHPLLSVSEDCTKRCHCAARVQPADSGRVDDGQTKFVLFHLSVWPSSVVRARDSRQPTGDGLTTDRSTM